MRLSPNGMCSSSSYRFIFDGNHCHIERWMVWRMYMERHVCVLCICFIFWQFYLCIFLHFVFNWHEREIMGIPKYYCFYYYSLSFWLRLAWMLHPAYPPHTRSFSRIVDTYIIRSRPHPAPFSARHMFSNVCTLSSHNISSMNAASTFIAHFSSSNFIRHNFSAIILLNKKPFKNNWWTFENDDKVFSAWKFDINSRKWYWIRWISMKIRRTNTTEIKRKWERDWDLVKAFNENKLIEIETSRGIVNIGEDKVVHVIEWWEQNDERISSERHTTQMVDHMQNEIRITVISFTYRCAESKNQNVCLWYF